MFASACYRNVCVRMHIGLKDTCLKISNKPAWKTRMVQQPGQNKKTGYAHKTKPSQYLLPSFCQSNPTRSLSLLLRYTVSRTKQKKQRLLTCTVVNGNPADESWPIVCRIELLLALLLLLFPGFDPPVPQNSSKLSPPASCGCCCCCCSAKSCACNASAWLSAAAAL